VLPDEAAAHADYVVVGEGEQVWPEVVAAAERGVAAARFDGRAAGPVDLATLPTPRYDLIAGRPYSRFTVQTSRGCPWRCEFCASSVMLQQRYRRRPVAQIVRDLDAIERVQPGAFIEFADDNTFVDHEWSRELCAALAPRRMKWFTETDLSVADDPALCDAIARSGCRQLLIGLESPGETALRGVEQRADWKAGRAPDYGRSLRELQSRDVTVNGCFVLGLDRHGPEIFAEVLDFAETNALWEVQVTVLTPFPGTPLYARLEREGRLLAPGRWERCTLFDVNFTPARMSVEELRRGLRWLTERLYSPAALRRRRRAFLARRRASAHGRALAATHS